MPRSGEVLRFKKKDESVEIGTELHQTSDGTIFYYKYLHTPRRLYMKKWRKAEHGNPTVDGVVLAKYPDGFPMPDRGGIKADFLGAHGNAMYFESMGKIYKAEFTAPEDLSVTYLREMLEDEHIHTPALASRRRNGKRYIYRLCDDPLTDGVAVNAYCNYGLWSFNQDLSELKLKALHRGNLIFERPSMTDTPSISKIADNVVLIETHNCGTGSGFADHGSPLVYNVETTASGQVLVVYNTETMETRMIPTDLPDTYSVVGVHDGQITVHKDYDVYTARLPDIVFD